MFFGRIGGYLGDLFTIHYLQKGSSEEELLIDDDDNNKDKSETTSGVPWKIYLTIIIFLVVVLVLYKIFNLI